MRASETEGVGHGVGVVAGRAQQRERLVGRVELVAGSIGRSRSPTARSPRSGWSPGCAGWCGRTRTPTAPVPMTEEQRRALEKLARSTSLPHRKVTQAKALLLAADGVATNEVARRCGTTNDSVRAWRRRFEAEGV